MRPRFKVTRMFFDSEAVTRVLDRRTRKVLSRFGAYVRTSGRRSMRPARKKTLGEMSTIEREQYQARADAARESGGTKPKKPLASSKPGEAPRVITALVKRFLFFSYAADQDSVVVGPEKLNRTSDGYGRPVGGTQPETLEHGGAIRIREVYDERTKSWRPQRKRPPSFVKTRMRTVAVEPRPFMGPALQKELPRLPQMWRDN